MKSVSLSLIPSDLATLYRKQAFDQVLEKLESCMADSDYGEDLKVIMNRHGK